MYQQRADGGIIMSTEHSYVPALLVTAGDVDYVRRRDAIMRKHTPYDRTRNRNPFWKGGRTIASNGYVLIKVGTDHHLADVRGYAYEHRLVAEELIGRRLLPGEQIHHRDGNKQNNAPENLEITASRSHHAVLHRTKTGRQLPGEVNPEIECACGCGVRFLKYDPLKRPRRFVSGHNGRKAA